MNNYIDSFDLTICSVYHSLESKRLLELNYDIVQQLNPNVRIRWIVSDNTSSDFSEKLDSQKFLIVPGAREIHGVPQWAWGSYRHAYALKNTLSHIITRFALFLDNDFYILVPSWISVVPRYMQKHDLSFFGVPWHPAHYKKWRYFPSPHTLFVDLTKIEREQLIFQPFYREMTSRSLYSRIVRKVQKSFPLSGLLKRFSIGTSVDTGYSIYRQFVDKVKYECPQPVFRKRAHGFDRILLDRFRFVPKRKNYFSTKGFREYGLYDCDSMGWEEFMWQGKPYGFHIRGSHKLQNNLEEHTAYIRYLLDQLLRISRIS